MIGINLTGLVLSGMGFLTIFIFILTIWKWNKIDTITRIEGIGVVILSLIALNNIYYDFSKDKSNKETLIRDNQQSQIMFQRKDVSKTIVVSTEQKIKQDYNSSKNEIEKEMNTIHNSIKKD